MCVFFVMYEINARLIVDRDLLLHILYLVGCVSGPGLVKALEVRMHMHARIGVPCGFSHPFNVRR